jgi:hypothetical protein
VSENTQVPLTELHSLIFQLALPDSKMAQGHTTGPKESEESQVEVRLPEQAGVQAESTAAFAQALCAAVSLAAATAMIFLAQETERGNILVRVFKPIMVLAGPMYSKVITTKALPLKSGGPISSCIA